MGDLRVCFFIPSCYNHRMGCFDFLNSYSAVAIIGMCKNAGKTTALNRIIREFDHMAPSLAITSIGRDGESTDIATKTPKPSIYIYEGTTIATAEGVMRACDITREILDTTGISTPLGEVVIIRALSDGYVQIAGPSTVEGLIRVSALMRNTGAKQVLVDGAISRKSLSSPELCQAVVLCTGASYAQDMNKTVRSTAFMARLLSTPETRLDAALLGSVYDVQEKYVLLGNDITPVSDAASLVKALRDRRGDRALFISGAITDSILSPVLESGVKNLELVAENPSKLLLTQSMHDRLAIRKITISARSSSNLAAITINPYSAYGMDFDRESFATSLLNELKDIDCPIIDALTGETYRCCH